MIDWTICMRKLLHEPSEQGCVRLKRIRPTQVSSDSPFPLMDLHPMLIEIIWLGWFGKNNLFKPLCEINF